MASEFMLCANLGGIAMSKLFFSAALVCAMTCSSAVLANGTQTEAQQPAKLQTTELQSTADGTAPDISKQVVCSSSFHDGTIIKQPVCLTRDQRNLNRLREQQNIRDIQTRSLQTSNNW
jgi:hypothetical protein